MPMNRSVVLCFYTVLALLCYTEIVSPVYAESVGSEINVPIYFVASEPVTAADFTVAVSGGTLQSVGCGGSGFVDLGLSAGNRCVVFNYSGGTTGIFATAVVSANTIGTLTVTASGTLSTSLGEEPSLYEISGAEYEIINAPTSTPTNTPTNTPTPTSTPTNTPTPTPTLSVTFTPTPSGQLPNSGTLELTGSVIVIGFLTIVVGAFALFRL